MSIVPGRLQRTRHFHRAHLIGAVVSLLCWLIFSPAAVSGQPSGVESGEWDQRLEKLRSIPYLDFSETVVSESDTGVVLHDPSGTWEGFNFYCSRSSGQVFLMDMSGCTVHRWTYQPKKGAGSDHAVLLGNGDVLVLQKHEYLLRLNWNSRPIWKRRLRVHHDLAVAGQGTFYVIVRDWKSYRGMRVWFDALLHLDADGQELDRWHTFDRLDELKVALDPRPFLDTVLDSALGGRPDRGVEASMVRTEVANHRFNFDYFHLNSVRLLPATPLGDRDRRFQTGNLLICLRNVNQILILDAQTYGVQWSWGQGTLERPHHPTMLSDGHILVFDNGVNREYSRVLELDPETKTIVWQYQEDPPGEFYSYSRGAAQRLPNGNTLITESDRGRVFEVTESGQTVWAWHNPMTRSGHRETVYRMSRLPREQVEPMLRHWWWWSTTEN